MRRLKKIADSDDQNINPNLHNAPADPNQSGHPHILENSNLNTSPTPLARKGSANQKSKSAKRPKNRSGDDESYHTADQPNESSESSNMPGSSIKPKKARKPKADNLLGLPTTDPDLLL